MPDYPKLSDLIQAAKKLPDAYQERRQAMDGERRLAFLRPATDNAARKNFAVFVAAIAAQIETHRNLNYANWDKAYASANPEFARQLEWSEFVFGIHPKAILGAFFVARREVLAEYNNNEESAVARSSLVQTIDKLIGTCHTPEQVAQYAEALKRVSRVIAANVAVQWHPGMDNQAIEAKIDAMHKEATLAFHEAQGPALDALESEPSSSMAMSC